MAVSNEAIQQWWSDNDGATDADIAKAMDQYGVNAQQLGSAIGYDPAAIQQRYDVSNVNQNIGYGQTGWSDAYAKASGGGGYTPPANAGGGSYTGISSGAPQQPRPNLGMGGENPYLGQHAAAITNQVTQNLQRNILPNISSGAMSAGGFGGSRQGVVEANALNDANQGLSNALAGMYSNDWNQQQGRNLSQYGMDQNYNLGMGNLGLNAQNSTNNFYTAQRGQDLQAAGLGASLAQAGNQGFLGQGQGMYNIGSTYNNAPWATAGNYGQVLQPWGNNTGSASSTSSTSSNPWANAIGGALLGGTFKLL